MHQFFSETLIKDKFTRQKISHKGNQKPLLKLGIYNKYKNEFLN